MYFVGYVKNFICIEKIIKVAENRQKTKAEEVHGGSRVRG